VEHPDDRHPDECCRTVPEVTVPNRTRGCVLAIESRSHKRSGQH
jgi:hypothetical protein